MTVKGGQLSSLMPYWSSTVHTFGEGPCIIGLDNNGGLRWATFVPGGGGLLYERITVDASAATVMVVHLKGPRPTEPETPWSVPTGQGVHSFVLPTWSTTLGSVRVVGSGLRILRLQSGSISLGPPV